MNQNIIPYKTHFPQINVFRSFGWWKFLHINGIKYLQLHFTQFFLVIFYR